MPVSAYDVVIIAILAISTVVGLVRGFSREVISLGSWALAIVLALHYASTVADRFLQRVPSEVLRYICAFIIIVAAVLLVGSLVARILGALISVTGLGFLDRLLGILFGLLRGVMVIALLCCFISLTAYSDQAWYTQSQLKVWFTPISKQIEHYLPDHLFTVDEWQRETSYGLTNQDEEN